MIKMKQIPDENAYAMPATPNPDNTVIEVSGLNKSFGNNRVLKNFNLKLQEGENLVVLGKSGSGKSVLIKCIVGLITTDSGNINVLGNNIPDLEHDELDCLRADIGFLFQGSALYDSMTVRENLEFPLRRHVEKFGEHLDSLQLVREALHSVGLERAIDLMPAALSGGMKKRVALARALILKPRIMFYDEPTSGLDPITAKEICYLILELQQKFRTSSLIITHDMECARITSNRVAILIDGENYVEGLYEELAKSADPNIKAFFK